MTNLAADVRQDIIQGHLQRILLRRRERIESIADDPDDCLDVVAVNGRCARTCKHGTRWVVRFAEASVH